MTRGPIPALAVAPAPAAASPASATPATAASAPPATTASAPLSSAAAAGLLSRPLRVVEGDLRDHPLELVDALQWSLRQVRGW